MKKNRPKKDAPAPQLANLSSPATTPEVAAEPRVDKLVTISTFYSDMHSRLSHLENLRHGSVAAQLAILGGVITPFFAKDNSERLKDPELAGIAMVVAILIQKLLELMAHNLFAKSMRAAEDLMVCEYVSQLPEQGVGYFCFRKAGSRWEFFVSGFASEFFVIFTFSALCYLAPSIHQNFLGIVSSCVILSTWLRLVSLSWIFHRKDRLEEISRAPVLIGPRVREFRMSLNQGLDKPSRSLRRLFWFAPRLVSAAGQK